MKQLATAKKLLSHSRRFSHQILLVQGRAEVHCRKILHLFNVRRYQLYMHAKFISFCLIFLKRQSYDQLYRTAILVKFYFILYGPDKPVNFLRHETISIPRYPRSRWKIRLRLRFDPSFRGNSIFWSNCSNFDLNYQDISPEQLGHGR